MRSKRDSTSEGVSLAHLEQILEASWECWVVLWRLGKILREVVGYAQAVLRGVSGACRMSLGDLLGASWGPPQSLLGASLGPLGNPLEASWRAS